jgi:fructose-bisphosphate aldolase class II
MQELCQLRYEAFGSAGYASKIKAIPLNQMVEQYI